MNDLKTKKNRFSLINRFDIELKKIDFFNNYIDYKLRKII